jgi:hypothetical protein
MYLALAVPLFIVAIIIGVPWITFTICRRLPNRTLRLMTCLILIVSPVALLHVYFTYGYTLRRTPGLEYLPTIIGWSIVFSPSMAFGAFLSVFPDWAVDRILYGIEKTWFSRSFYYGRSRRWF